VDSCEHCNSPLVSIHGREFSGQLDAYWPLKNGNFALQQAQTKKQFLMVAFIIGIGRSVFIKPSIRKIYIVLRYERNIDIINFISIKKFRLSDIRMTIFMFKATDSTGLNNKGK
jgi:hypothetical protein